MTRKLSSYSELSQGLIFDGVQLDNSTGYGIIISADCDIAQKKINQVSYITVYPFKKFVCNIYCPECIQKKVEKWVNQEGMELSYIENLIRASITPFDDWCRQKHIPNEICFCLKKKVLPQISCENCLLPVNNTDLKSYITKLLKDNLYHYFYIPDLGGGERDGGVANFVEIRSLPFHLAQRIPNGFTPKREECEKYALSRETEFLMPIGRLQSPHREHFMQRFAQHFIRIGLDDYDSTFANHLAKRVKSNAS